MRGCFRWWIRPLTDIGVTKCVPFKSARPLSCPLFTAGHVATARLRRLVPIPVFPLIGFPYSGMSIHALPLWQLIELELSPHGGVSFTPGIVCCGISCLRPASSRSSCRPIRSHALTLEDLHPRIGVCDRPSRSGFLGLPRRAAELPLLTFHLIFRDFCRQVVQVQV